MIAGQSDDRLTYTPERFGGIVHWSNDFRTSGRKSRTGGSETDVRLLAGVIEGVGEGIDDVAGDHADLPFWSRAMSPASPCM